MALPSEAIDGKPLGIIDDICVLGSGNRSTRTCEQSGVQLGQAKLPFPIAPQIFESRSNQRTSSSDYGTWRATVSAPRAITKAASRTSFLGVFAGQLGMRPRRQPPSHYDTKTG